MTRHTPQPGWRGHVVCLISLLPVAFGGLVSACHAADAPSEVVKVEVRQVGFDPVSRSPVLILEDEAHTRAMPIWIGASEARAIELELRGEPAPRPLTHDLVKDILEQVGVGFEKVIVSELKDSTYYARIHLSRAGAPFEIDSRPSDAIALALRFQRPIFVASGLLEAAFPLDPRDTTKQVRQTLSSIRIAGVSVQNVSADLAHHFQLSDTSGVLVADVHTDMHADRAGQLDALQRGDIVLAVDGTPIQNVTDFQATLEERQGQTLHLKVQRNGKHVAVNFLSDDL